MGTLLESQKCMRCGVHCLVPDGEWEGLCVNCLGKDGDDFTLTEQKEMLKEFVSHKLKRQLLSVCRSIDGLSEKDVRILLDEWNLEV